MNVQVITITLTPEQFAAALREAVAAEVAPLKQALAELTQSDRMLSSAEAAKRMGIGPDTLKSYIKKGRLHPEKRGFIKLPATSTKGGHYRISLKEVDNFQSLFATSRTA